MDILRIYFELLGLFEMPWEILAFIFSSSIIIYWALRAGKWLVNFLAKIGIELNGFIVRMLLLPEFFITSLFRRFHLGSVPGVEAYDDFVEWLGSSVQSFLKRGEKVNSLKIRYRFWTVLLLMLIVGMIWFMRDLPGLRGTTALEYIDRGFGLYSSLANWALKETPKHILR